MPGTSAIGSRRGRSNKKEKKDKSPCLTCDFFQFGDCIADPNKVACEFIIQPHDQGHSIFPDEGMKFDDNKLMWDLLPLDAVEKIVEIMTYGAKKYAPNNWQKVKANRYYAALFRHLVAEYKGEDNDQESGMLHLAHAACNILFLLWKKMNDGKK